jgi:isopentenyl-diphosphate delta-isomerase
MVKPSSNHDGFIKRKVEHIEQALDERNQASTNGFEAISLIHEALPELDFNEISLNTLRLKKNIQTPFMVSSMTAGHPKGENINLILARACAETGWALGVGSQRRELFDKAAANEWQTLKAANLALELYGNIGISQLITSKVCDIQRLVDNLGASAMQVHLNPLQECIQVEGTPNFKGGLHAIEVLVQQLNVPVVIKETGCGLSLNTCQRLYNVGVSAIDVSGLGGTHWGRIEGARAKRLPNQQAAKTFQHWGIPTVSALKHAKAANPQGEVWGSGGVRSGLDAAKCLALGANTIGIAKPMLEAALKGVDELIALMRQFEHELKIALFCTGSASIEQLQETHRECF